MPIRVLLIDDDPIDAGLIELALNGNADAPPAASSFVLTMVGRLSAGLARLDESGADVVLLDLALPDSAGLNTVESVVRCAPGTPVVVLADRGDEVTAAQAVQAGAQDTLVKGALDADLLTRTLRYAVERSRAEARLRHSERRFRALIENSSDAILLVAADGTILYESHAVTRLLGYTPVERVGRNAFDFLHPDELPAATELFTQLLKDPSRPALAELRLRCKDGSWRWVEVVGSNQIADPSVGGIVANYRDVTGRKQAQEAQRLQSAALQAAANAIVITDRQGNIEWVNAAFTRMTGYSAEEAVGRNPRLLKSGAQSAEYYRDLWETITAGQVWRGELVNQREDGSLYTVEQTITPLRDEHGEVRRFIAVGQDVTDRKRAEWALRESEQRYRSLFEHMFVGLAYCRMFYENGAPQDFVYLDVNNAFADLTGLTDVVGRRVTEVIPGIRESNPELFEIYGRVALSGKPERFETYVPPLGIWFSVAVYSPEKEHFVAVFDNITERKRADEAVRRRADEFEALYETSLDIASQHDVHTLLASILERGIALLGTAAAEIYLFDSASGELILEASRGMPRPEASPVRVKLGQGASGLAGQIRRPVRVDDYRNWDNRLAELEGLPFTAVLSVPMLHGGDMIGVLTVAEVDQPRQLTEADARLLSLFAAQAASAVRDARRMEAVRQRLAELEAINRVSTALRAAQTLEEMLAILMDETLAVLDATAGAIRLYDPSNGCLRLAVARGWFAQGPPVFAADQGINGRVFTTGQPHVAQAFVRDPLWYHDPNAPAPPDLGGACVPIRTAEDVVGVMVVSVRLPREITPFELSLLTLLAEMAGSAIHRTRLHQQTERSLQRLAALRAVDLAITSSLDLHLTLDILLDQVTSHLAVDAAAVLLLNPHSQMLEYAAGRGFRNVAIHQTRVRLGEGHAGEAALERRCVLVPELATAAAPLTRAALLAGEGFVSHHVAPLIIKGQTKGVLEVFHRSGLAPDEEWLDFFEALAGQAAIAIDNGALFDDLQRSNLELGLAYDATIEGWSRALELRDRETEGHTQRVTDHTLRLARAMGMSESELIHVRRGALLHDIGKMGIPDAILLKAGPLTPEEWEEMRRHPQYAHEMLRPIVHLRPALDIPYCHHERWDGTGYPRRLKGEQIPLAARIFAAADVWDALRSDRPYRAAWPEAQARAYMRQQSGRRFDPRVIEFLMESLD